MFKCALATLGCKVNQCETEALAREMENYGYEIVDFSAKADVYIINTCCVTAEGERKSRQLVRRAIKVNPDAIIAVTGCAAQKAPESFAKIPGVTIVAGNSKKIDLPELIQEKVPTVAVEDMSHFTCYQDMPDCSIEKTRAFIKIQDGCNNFCSYCIIPYLRGRERSRSLESIIKQCEILAKQGFKEIVINGIHLSSYGKEWGITLADVVQAVCALDGIERVRLGSLEPNVITEEFLSKVTQSEKFCRQYHLSLQSGCDRVLKNMNRKYSTKEFKQAVDLIRQNYPLSAISTDIIVGFAKETDEDFAETKAFCEEIGFAWAHIFPYSIREGTVAAKMDGQLDKETKALRAKELNEICLRQSEEYRKQFIGQIKNVLCETNKDGIQQGLTEEHLLVHFPSCPSENQIVKVKITQVSPDGLVGERIE